MLFRSTNKPYLIVIVGDVGAGKTPWVEQLIRLLQSKDETVDGIISKKNQQSFDKWYHNLTRISTNEKHQLTTMKKIDTNIKIGQFYFFEDCLDWGNKQLKSIQYSNWLIVDEVGLLEFEGGGILPGMQSLVTNFSGCLVITIRSALFQNLDSFITEQLPAIKSWQQHIIKL